MLEFLCTTHIRRCRNSKTINTKQTYKRLKSFIAYLPDNFGHLTLFDMPENVEIEIKLGVQSKLRKSPRAKQVYSLLPYSSLPKNLASLEDYWVLTSKMHSCIIKKIKLHWKELAFFSVTFFVTRRTLHTYRHNLTPLLCAQQRHTLQCFYATLLVRHYLCLKKKLKEKQILNWTCWDNISKRKYELVL